MPFLDDAEIEAAKSQKCILCLAQAGEECIDIISGKPLLEAKGRPIHIVRREP